MTLIWVVAIGISMQWLAWRFRVPAVVLLLLAGALVGPVFNVIDPTAEFGYFVSLIVKLAVAVILFDGGLNLRAHEFKNSAVAIRRLVFLGVPFSWALGTVAAYYIAGLSLPVSMILSAILVVTGPTVIMPLIRQAGLSSSSASLLKWEGIVNDPIGALLAVLVYDYFLTSSEGGGHLPHVEVMLGVAKALGAGGFLGLAAGFLVQQSFVRAWVPEFLKIPIILCFIFTVYGLADAVQHEAGLLAVTVFGYFLGNIGLHIIDELRRFKEYITIFLVSTVFILLTASIKVSDLENLNLRSLFYIAAVLFLVRPVATWLATFGAKMDQSERKLLCWIAPRGVVAACPVSDFA